LFIFITDSIDENFTELHPDDPKCSLPTNRLELKDRILRGPFQPVLTMFPRSTISGIQRSFHKNWYEQFTKLEYSPKNDCAFCFPCRVFKNSSGINVGQSDTTFSKNGFSNWKMASQKFKLHQTSRSHLNSVTSMTDFINSKSIDLLLMEENKKLLNERGKKK